MAEKVCIYHGDCLDGFTGAWIIHRLFRDDVEFIPGLFYNSVMPNVKNKDVIIIDYGFKHNEMIQILEEARSVLLLDHHGSTIREIHGLSHYNNFKFVLDEMRSGCLITWDYFFPNTEPPEFLKCINDIDLMRFKVEKSREVSYAIASYEYTFENWDNFEKVDIKHLKEIGDIINRKFKRDFNNLAKISKRRIKIEDYVVWTINVPYFYADDVFDLLSEDEPFVCCYYDLSDHRKFSLRSHIDGVDVSKIAEIFGGGGRQNSAAFYLTFEEACQFELNNF